MSVSPRIVRLKILFLCCLRACFFGKANRVSSEISKIIFIPTGKLGDIVCNTPVLRAIRENLPKATIVVAGESRILQPVLADSGLVDEYLDLLERGAVRALRRHQAQVALVTGPSYLSVASAYLAGIPLVVGPTVEGGFSPFQTRPYKILEKFIKTFPYRIDGYAPRERLKVLESLGIFSNDTKKQLGFSILADEKIKRFFSDNNIDLEKDFIIGISPSAGNKIKEWPIERFADVADHIYAKYNSKLIIIGDKTDSEKNKRLASLLDKKTCVIDCSGLFFLDELKALISKLDIFISVDTGPIYIAEAFNVPTINIVGPVDEKVQPPQGFIHRNVLPLNRVRAELSILNARHYNKEEALRQVLSISVLAVVEVIDGLIRDVIKKSNYEK